MVSTIRFKNFKIFKQWQTLELRPITILIGKNNSGKSAVAKLPVMIAGSLSGKYSAPLPLSHEGIRIAASNEELFYNKGITLDSLDFVIENSKDKIEFSILGDRRYKIALYRYKVNEQEIDIKNLKINGLATSSIDISSFLFDFDYIDSSRKVLEPQSDIYEEYEKIGINGENAYKILPQYFNNTNPALTQIKNWFKQNFEGWEMNIRQIASSTPRYEVVLSNSSIKDIGIESTGSGIKQVLPLIVRSFMPVSEPILIIIEEPETHLHPAAHGVLAQRFAESYLEDNNRKYLIETHSQNFVLRMRRLVAEGKLKPEDLAIYYVEFDEEENESNLKRIEVDDLGRVAWWPEHIFSETLIETTAIRNAQLDRTTL